VLGVAERKPVVKNANTARKTPITKKSAPIVARPVTEGVEEIFFIGRTLLKSALRFGKLSEGGRLFVLVFFSDGVTSVGVPFGRRPSLSAVWSLRHPFGPMPIEIKAVAASARRRRIIHDSIEERA
jgi:hypothetical protein